MKFKQWLQQETLGTPVLHGGIGEIPGDDNRNMPVRGHWATNDGAAPKDPTPDINAEKVFGFNRRDRRRLKNWASRGIDNPRDKPRFPLDTRNPASIGFSAY